MKIFITLFTFFIFFTIYAQEDATHCAKKDAFSNSQMKSNTLTINQIDEAKKYNVHFYSLDLEMDNLVTDVAGTGGIHATANETLDSALFELFSSFTITEIRLNGTPTPYSRNGSAIKVPVNITVGQNFEIEVDYSGTPPNASTNPLGGAGNKTLPILEKYRMTDLLN